MTKEGLESQIQVMQKEIFDFKKDSRQGCKETKNWKLKVRTYGARLGPFGPKWKRYGPL